MSTTNRHQRYLGLAQWFIVLTSIGLFTWWQAYISGRYIPKDFIVPALAMAFAWGVCTLLARKRYFWIMRLWALLLALLCAVTCVLFEYYFGAGIHLSLYDIGALMQTNVHEAASFVSEFMISPFSVASFVMVLLWILGGAELLVFRVKQCAYSQSRLRTKGLRSYISTAGVLLCMIGSVICVTEMTSIKYSLKFMSLVQSSLDYVASAKPLEEIEVTAQKEQQGELYVMIIGESQNRDYMGLYNKLFDTTPKLEATLQPENSIIFTQAYACFTHTVPVLAHALSNQLIGQTRSANLADIITEEFVPLSAVLKGANIHNFWLSNQSEQGLSDTDTTMLARTFEGTKFMTASEFEPPKLDEVLIAEFQQELAKLDQTYNNVIIIHMMGTHGLYHDRYTSDYVKYQPEQLTMRSIGSLAYKHAPEISYYLNATYYNDYILSELLDLARKQPSFMGLLFFSDHADQPPFGHHYSNFHYGMTHIPMFFTFSDRYAQRYGDKVANLRARQAEFFVNDRVYDLFLDVMDVKSDAYRSELSLASADFKPLTLDDAALPQGKNVMLDPDYQVWRQWPLLQERMAILRCNSDKKMGMVQSLGVAAAEIDVAYDSDMGLCLNHERCETGDLPLASFLQQHRSSLAQLWLDLKEDTDKAEALAELSALDGEFDLKAMAVLESANLDLLKQLQVAGWRVSYRVSRDQLQDNLAQLKTVQIEAISFDSALYEQVNELIAAQQLPALKQYVRAQEVELGSLDIAAQIAPYEHATTVLVPLETYFDY